MRKIQMKTLLVVATFASLAISPAYAWTYPSFTFEHFLSNNNVQVSGSDAAEHLLPVVFPDPVATNPASVVIALEEALVLIDPVGNQAQYSRYGRPDIVILTRAHPDHLSIDTMIGLLRRDTVVLAPQDVINQLPLMISNNVISPFDAGATQDVRGIRFHALPTSSDIPPGAQVYARERGDIFVEIEYEGARFIF